MKPTTRRLKLILTGLIAIAFVGVAHAVIESFDDIALDGAGSDPFIRFDDGPSKYIVGFTDNLAFWSGSSYSLRIFQTATSDSVVLRDGFVGIGENNPTEMLHVDGNALITGNLELGSSREIKGNITDLALEDALDTVQRLNPVRFHYLHSPHEESVGFIAEDVPDLVATEKRNSLSPMDMVAVLTKVVQQQQQTIDSLSQQVAHLCSKQEC
jgi:hypothetical protein